MFYKQESVHSKINIFVLEKEACTIPFTRCKVTELSLFQI